MKPLSAKTISCLTLLFYLTATSLMTYLLSSSNWYLISRNYYRSTTEKQGSSECNLFTGNWIPSSLEPYYTNASNCRIDDRQDCMTFGRSDTEFMKWRWKPDNCELPRFNATQFLELVRGKTMAFIGDSLARNHMQSLTCMLSRADDPVDMWTLWDPKLRRDWRFRQWRFSNYNFTINSFWSRFLVKSEDGDTTTTPPTTHNLHLNEADEIWATHIHTFDYVIISAGQWFLQPLVYYQNGDIIGCRKCGNNTITPLGMSYGYRTAFRTAFRALLDSDKFNGTVFLRTYSPRHYEGGEWNTGGSCPRTKPTRRPEMGVEKGYAVSLYRTAIDELKGAEKVGRKKGLKFGMIDQTEMMGMRADGHPNRFGPGLLGNVTAPDCAHWCLPGPIDTWNEILLQLMLA